MTDSSSSTDLRKAELLGALSEAQVEARSLQGRAQEIVETATLNGEMAGSLLEVVQALPDASLSSNQSMGTLTAGWKAQVALMRALSKGIDFASTFSVSTQVVALTTSISVMVGDEVGRWTNPRAAQAATHLNSLLHRPETLQEVQEAFRRFGVDQPCEGRRSAAELLDEARAALTRPGEAAAAPAAVLVPAREAIHTVLSQLLRRRPKQEPAGSHSAKVRSIGSQCGKSGLATDHFDRLGADVEALLARLSGAKQDALTHYRLVELFDGALLFHKAFLDSLDLGRLRG